jgi:SAM-dependent methyltransferase
VQLGSIGKMDLLDACAAPSRIVLDLLDVNHGPAVRGIPEELPFDTESVDIVVMPHTLDFTNEPHQVLREVQRILNPEGHVVLIGFNPFGFWGLRRSLTLGNRRVPWCGHFLRLARIKDWMALLDFDLTQGSMLYYRPPLKKDHLRDRLFFLDSMGDRWWPMMAAVYIVVAKKRVPGVMPLPVKWKKKHAVGPAAESAASSMLNGSARGRLRRFG